LPRRGIPLFAASPDSTEQPAETTRFSRERARDRRLQRLVTVECVSRRVVLIRYRESFVVMCMVLAVASIAAADPAPAGATRNVVLPRIAAADVALRSACDALASMQLRVDDDRAAGRAPETDPHVRFLASSVLHNLTATSQAFDAARGLAPDDPGLQRVAPTMDAIRVQRDAFARAVTAGVPDVDRWREQMPHAMTWMQRSQTLLDAAMLGRAITDRTVQEARAEAPARAERPAHRATRRHPATAARARSRADRM
jgi:hypothetical protein